MSTPNGSESTQSAREADNLVELEHLTKRFQVRQGVFARSKRRDIGPAASQSMIVSPLSSEPNRTLCALRSQWLPITGPPSLGSRLQVRR